MPRRAEITPRTLEPDPMHGSVLVSQVVNRVLREEERRGTVELKRAKTIVLDLDGLARRAG